MVEEVERPVQPLCDGREEDVAPGGLEVVSSIDCAYNALVPCATAVATAVGEKLRGGCRADRDEILGVTLGDVGAAERALGREERHRAADRRTSIVGHVERRVALRHISGATVFSEEELAMSACRHERSIRGERSGQHWGVTKGCRLCRPGRSPGAEGGLSCRQIYEVDVPRLVDGEVGFVAVVLLVLVQGCETGRINRVFAIIAYPSQEANRTGVAALLSGETGT